ncbi:MAG: hypothetical protein JRE14_15305 [Deltaproteobacteria bacterium]|nr:hypothetical protein [Deltaproteobacteria bacterium]
MDEARFHAAELLKIEPNYSLDYNRNTTFHKDPSSKEHIINALRTLGFPEHSPE